MNKLIEYTKNNTLSLVLKGLSITLLIVYIKFSLEFYSDIDKKLMIFMGLLEITLYLFGEILADKRLSDYRVHIYIFMALIMVMSWGGFIANGINKSVTAKNDQIKLIDNPEYKKYSDKLKRFQDDFKRYNDKLDSYPTLETYIKSSNIPKWENKENIIKEYNKEKNKIETKINEIETNINDLKEPNKKITIGTKKVGGFSEMIKFIQFKTGLNFETINIIIYGIIGVLAMFGIYGLSFLSYKLKISKTSKDNSKDISKTKTENVLENKIPRTPVKSDVLGTKEAKTLVKSDVLENKIPRTPVKNSVRDNIVLEKKSNVLETNKNILESSKTNFDNVLENILEYLRINYKNGDIIKKFQNTFELSEYEYKKIRNKLIELNIIDTKNKRMIYIEESNLKIVK